MRLAPGDNVLNIQNRPLNWARKDNSVILTLMKNICICVKIQ